MQAREIFFFGDEKRFFCAGCFFFNKFLWCICGLRKEFSHAVFVVVEEIRIRAKNSDCVALTAEPYELDVSGRNFSGFVETSRLCTTGLGFVASEVLICTLQVGLINISR